MNCTKCLNQKHPQMSNNREYSLTVQELGVTAREVTDYITKDDTPEKEFFTQQVAAELEEMKDEKVLFGYSIFSASIKDFILTTNNTQFNIGHDVSLMLRSAEKIVLFACTLSERLDNIITKYKSNNQYLEAYLMDITGTVIIGKTAEKVLEQIKNNKAFEGYKITNTISPGNCGWPVEEQKKLFSLLPDSFLNISLNESGMMHPVKSLTGVIGIGERVIYKQTECRYCKSRNCPYRKEEYV